MGENYWKGKWLCAKIGGMRKAHFMMWIHDRVVDQESIYLIKYSREAI